MKFKNVAISLGAGIAAAYLVKKQLNTPAVSSDKALSIVKSAFKQKGPVDGSWIYTIPEDYTTDDQPHKVYRAGITRTIQGKLEQYEAVVDTETGNILDVTVLEK
ncbi:hypothetical protein GJU40_11175 [Bacillus lacus]|uniref:PepSY domain-containing protein n=1 Tax=Metabacillus lacus TaxID=1983721 RepID=A0A7X2LXM0_9BACI|nr:PepSY domain-containing protein [Metabacillus lacus]MRX72710.1 hypothetical protein [Metabacillus lacus]